MMSRKYIFFGNNSELHAVKRDTEYLPEIFLILNLKITVLSTRIMGFSK